MNRKNYSLYMYSCSVLRLYNLRMAVRVKKCGVHTVGMGSGFGKEITGS
jgi:hypothetical protein